MVGIFLFSSAQIFPISPVESKAPAFRLEELIMSANNILDENALLQTPCSHISNEKTRQDIAYYRAQEISKLLFDSGLISLLEYNNLSELNLKTFSPILAEIMPRLT